MSHKVDATCCTRRPNKLPVLRLACCLPLQAVKSCTKKISTNAKTNYQDRQCPVRMTGEWRAALAACLLPLHTTILALGGVIVCWFGGLTSRLGGLTCPGCRLQACQPGRCTSPSSPGSWLCPRSGSEGSAQAPHPLEASAHPHQSTPHYSQVHCLTSVFNCAGSLCM